MNRRNRRRFILVGLLLAGASSCAAATRTAVNATTLDGKVLLGYQGWFNCPGPGSPDGRWSAWSRGVPTPETVTVDLFPDLSEFHRNDLCLLPGFTVGIGPAYVYSARNRNVVEGHFRWMEEYGLDGVLVQRFVSNIAAARKDGDVVLHNIAAAAAKHGRVFAIEYDVTGADPVQVVSQLQEDWRYLVDDLKITLQPGYLHQNGRPLLSVWGMGFGEDRNPPHDVHTAIELIRWFRERAPEPQRVFYVGGVPSHWRSGTDDARSGWQSVYAMMDAIQPWSVGRYRDEAGADRWRREILEPDLAATAARGQMYMPVIFPGFSWHNLKRATPLNAIPRQGGRFLWRQAFDARAAGAGMLKIAMFDEVNEGTAVFKAASSSNHAPQQGEWLTLDADGTSLPCDWYLRLSRAITRVFHGEASNSPAMPARP